jgi:ATP-dependent RNA helicase DHX37/DHR1
VTSLQLKIIRQAIAAGFIDQVAVRKDRADKASSTGVQSATSKAVPYKALGIAEDVFIHPSSVLADMSPPEYIVFNEVVRSSRVWLKGKSAFPSCFQLVVYEDLGLTVVNPAWLSSLGKPSLCTFSKPVKNTSGVMMVIPKFGPDGWELPAVPANTLSS